MSKPVFDWEQLTADHKPDKSGVQYLVGTSYLTGPSHDKSNIFVSSRGENLMFYHIAEWYNKGDGIELDCTAEVKGLTKDSTDEERLLAVIFGAGRSRVPAPKDGFYIKEYLTKEEEEDHPGYYEWFRCIADTDDYATFYVDLPYAPEGYVDHTEYDKDSAAAQKRAFIEMENERLEYYMSLTDKNGRYAKIYDIGCQRLGEADEFVLNGYVYRNDDETMRRVASLTGLTVDLLSAFKEKVGTDRIRESFEAQDADMCRKIAEDCHELTKEIMPVEGPVIFTDQRVVSAAAYGAFSHPVELDYALVAPDDDNDVTPEDYLMQRSFIYAEKFIRYWKKFKRASYEQRYIGSVNLNRLDNRLNRLYRLIELGAPTVISDKEYGMVLEQMWYFLNEPLREADDFAEFYRLDKLGDDVDNEDGASGGDED